MNENLIYLYSNSQSKKHYLIDKNTFSIYLYYPQYTFNFTKIITKVYTVLIGLLILFVILNIESIRILFYVTILGREARYMIILLTIFLQILLVLFYKKSFTKLYPGHKEKLLMNLKDEEKLLKESLIHILYLTSISLVIGAAFLLPISIRFIKNSNAIMYFWFLLLSSIFIRYPAIIIAKIFIPVLGAYLKLKKNPKN